MAKRLPIVLYGATGYTGQLIAQELDTRSIDFAVSGRNRDKLEALSDSLASKPEVIVADVSDGPSLQGMAARGRVVISAAGPFRTLGPPVQEACLKAKAHFVDITGETPYMLDTFSRNQSFKDAGVMVVNAAGFDVVPTDLAAWLAVNTMEGAEQVDIGLCVENLAGSQGTLRSMIGMLSAEPVSYESGEWRPQPLGAFSRGFNFPEPFGRKEALFFPTGDVVTAPRTTGAHTVRTYFAIPEPRLAKALGPLLRGSSKLPLGRLAESRVGKRLLHRLIGDGNAGPDSTQRANTRFALFADARGTAGRHTAWVMGSDPYGLTAVTAVEIARGLAAGEIDKPGVLTPVEAMADPNAFLEHLKGVGVTWGQTDV